MEFNVEPLAIKYARKAIRIYDIIFSRHFGKAPIDFDTVSCRLICTKTPLKRLHPKFWVFQQVAWLFVYGLVGTTWYILCAPVPLYRKLVMLTALLSSLPLNGVVFTVFNFAKDIEVGANSLLNLQSHIVRGYRKQWSHLAEVAKRRDQLTGRILCVGTFIWATCEFNAGGVVMFKADLTYPLFGFDKLKDTSVYGLNIWLALILLRISGVFCLAFVTGRILSFMFIFCFLTVQAYTCILTIAHSINAPMRAIQEYRKLLISHTMVSPFMNRLNGFIILFGHTLTVAASWVGIRARDITPMPLVFLYMIVVILVLSWVFFMLKVLCNIQEKSNLFKIKMANRTQLVTGARNQQGLKSLVNTLFPTKFACGNSLNISEDSPGCFIMAFFDNLTSVLLAF